MYFSYIRPILEYGDIIWDNCFNYAKDEIEKIQIEAGRIVTGATKSCFASKILEETGWESLDTRRRKHRLTTFYKMTSRNTPSYLSMLVPRTVHQVSQRNLYCVRVTTFKYPGQGQCYTATLLFQKQHANGIHFQAT